MSHLRHYARSRLGALLVFCLLFVPVALSGHSHGSGQTPMSGACAACVATHHSPALIAPPIPHVVSALQHGHVVAAYAAVAREARRASKSSRAPPIPILLTSLV